MAWQVYDAKARFNEFIDASLKDGPQIITRRGGEAAVLISIDEWKHLKERT
jgi:prevent-host-death family protein